MENYEYPVKGSTVMVLTDLDRHVTTGNTIAAMQIMTRYVLTELLKVFSLSLAALTGLFIVVGGVKEALDLGIPPTQIPAILPYVLLISLRYTVPVTLLLATTLVYARMSGANEIVAIKSLGISPMVILWPGFALAFLLSLLSVWINDLSGMGQRNIDRIGFEAAEEIAYSILRSERCYSTTQFSINVKRVEGRRLINPIVTIDANGDGNAITLVASTAELHADLKRGDLCITLYNMEVDAPGLGSGYIPGSREQRVPLSEAGRDGGGSSPATMPLSTIPVEIARHQQTIQQLESEYAARAGNQMLWGDFSGLTGPTWTHLAGLLAGEHSTLCRLRTEPPRRWAAGFSCLCFVCIGAPMAIWGRRGEPLTAFFLCFAPILVVYYPLLAEGIAGAKNGTLPPVSVWGGNLVLAAWGVWLLRKVMRY